MGSKTRISAANSATGRPRKISNRIPTATPQLRRRGPARCAADGAVVSDKLETLRDLIRSQDAGTNPDELFREAADYIVRLKTQTRKTKGRGQSAEGVEEEIREKVERVLTDEGYKNWALDLQAKVVGDVQKGPSCKNLKSFVDWIKYKDLA
ncbi:Unknown protein [Striga hermonthica]|uniref:Uncharacterized protein n=1 Tax=Striga hermonthica TaxID=68872 RepID=A0A9N7R9M4_STRHE|nr:Unknown protein [Striga hermonthica]